MAATRALLTRRGASDVRATSETFFTVVLYRFLARARRPLVGCGAARALVCSRVEEWIHFDNWDPTSVRAYSSCARLVLERPPTAAPDAIFPSTFVSRPLTFSRTGLDSALFYSALRMHSSHKKRSRVARHGAGRRAQHSGEFRRNRNLFRPRFGGGTHTPSRRDVRGCA